MQNLQLKGKAQFGKAVVSVDVQVILFEEEKIWYAYLPAFDLTGYGKTKEDAKDSLKIVLDEFIRYALNKKTFYSELKRLGWSMKEKNKRFLAPKISDLISENDQLKEIINTKQYFTTHYPVNFPAFA